jgi:glycosyltransferase involved in cell wall biosynthesis
MDTNVGFVMDKQPVTTVLMPVFNGSQYLRDAMASILSQTFTRFEFLIIDDGSSDDSVTIIKSFSDPRIRLVMNGTNLGLIETLNKGLLLARGRYVARMDCDDISHSERLALQVSYMDKHDNVAVCGCWIKAFGSQRFVNRYPLTDDLIRAQLLFENALAHPSVMMRRDVFLAERLFYDAGTMRAEDYDLWTRVPTSFKLANLNRILLYYRQHQQQVSAAFLSEQSDITRTIRRKQLEGLGMELTSETLDLHVKISQKKPEISTAFLGNAATWLLALQEKNSQTNIYDGMALAEIVKRYWWETCFHATELGFGAWKSYFSSLISRQARIGTVCQTLFLLKCLLRKHSNSQAT